LLQELHTTSRALQRVAIQRHRLNARNACSDMRDSAKARRERTRHPIELGGLVEKTGLVELPRDRRVTLVSAFL